MTDVQLELNLEECSPEEMKLYLMQKQIDEACLSMDKVRKKLFAELGVAKKMISSLQASNELLKDSNAQLWDLLKAQSHEKQEPETQWSYGKNDCLFDVLEYKEA